MQRTATPVRTTHALVHELAPEIHAAGPGFGSSDAALAGACTSVAFSALDERSARSGHRAVAAAKRAVRSSKCAARAAVAVTATTACAVAIAAYATHAAARTATPRRG